jgi:hypothetical protein
MTNATGSLRTLTFLILLAAPAAAAAQPPAQPPVVEAEPTTSRIRLGVAAAFAAPVGDWADIAGVGFGGIVGFEYEVIPGLAITGRTGYLHHLESNNDSSTSELPFLAGARYLFLQGDARPYVDVGVGPVIVWGRADTGFGDASDTELYLGLLAGGGLQYRALDIYAGGVFFHDGDSEDGGGFLVTVGYQFLRLY